MAELELHLGSEHTSQSSTVPVGGETFEQDALPSDLLAQPFCVLVVPLSIARNIEKYTYVYRMAHEVEKIKIFVNKVYLRTHASCFLQICFIKFFINSPLYFIV